MQQYKSTKVIQYFLQITAHPDLGDTEGMQARALDAVYRTLHIFSDSIFVYCEKKNLPKIL